jgi:putrescine aminotransferase
MTGSAFWHPFADMSAVAGHDFVLASGDGAHVYDTSGRRYLDATAGLWFCNIGHGRAELGQAAARQMTTLASYSNFGDLTTAPTLALADRLAALSGLPGAKVFFTSGGSDAVDTAVKMVRRYWALLDQPERTTIITRTRSYHGMHVAGTALAGITANRDGYGELDLGVRNCAWDQVEDLARVIAECGPERVAAFFCEPIIGAGGVYAPPEGYLQAARDLCREHGILFVADEVITGYGRTGAMFGSLRWDLQPDLLLTAKGLTSGYLPMGAVIVAANVAEPFWTRPGLVWRHGYTYSGHATAAVVAMANLDIIEGEHLVERVAEHQLAMAAELMPLTQHDLVHTVRAGVGLLAAVQLEPEALAQRPDLGLVLVKHVRERGVITRMLADGSVQISPPFVVTREDMRTIASAIDEALVEVGSTRAPGTILDVDLLPEQTSDDAGGFDSTDERLRADVPPHHVA